MALGEIIARLSVQLNMDSAAFEKGAARSGKQADDLGNRMEKMGFRVGSSMKAMGTALFAAGIAVVTQQLGKVVMAGLEHASALGEQAQQLGVTTDALQEYRYAATQVGISQEEMDKGLQKLTLTIGQAATDLEGKQAAAFAKFGVSVKDANGNVIDAGAAIPLLADAFEKLHSPAERAAFLAEFFGAKMGGKFQTLLAGGSKAVNQLRDAAHRMGVVMSSKEIQDADKAADKLADVKIILSAKIDGIVARNADSIFKLADAMLAVVDAANKAGQAIRRFKLMQGLAQETAKATVWSPDGPAKDAAIENAERFRAAIAEMDGKKKTTGMFANVPGWTPDMARSPAAAAKPAPAASRGGSVGGTSRGGGGSSGPSAADIHSRIDDQIAGLAQQAWSLQSGMVASAKERAEIELKAVELATLRLHHETANDNDIDRLGKEEAASQRKRIDLHIDAVADLERQRIAREMAASEEEEAADIVRQQNQAQRDSLQYKLGLADTDAERQRIALEIFALDEQDKRQTLERIIASASRTDAEKALAAAALQQLDANSGAARANVMRSNETQREAYLRSFQKTTGQISEAFDRVKIDGLESLNGAIVDTIMGAKSLGDAFKNVASQIIADLLRIAVQRAVIGPLADALFGGGSGGGTGGGSGLLGKIFGFANGTSHAPGGLALVGERGPELVNLPRGSKVYPNGTGPRQQSGNTIVMHNDFRGADAGAVAGISAKIDQLDRTIESRSIMAVADARERRIIR